MIRSAGTSEASSMKPLNAIFRPRGVAQTVTALQIQKTRALLTFFEVLQAVTM